MWTSVRHRYRPSDVAEIFMELVFNRIPWATCSVSTGASTLNHELWDHPMEYQPVVKPFIDEFNEIPGSQWCFILE
jgi:hypothetical protein